MRGLRVASRASWRRTATTTADTVEILEAGAGISAAGYLDAMRERARYTAVWSAFFERYDALLTPSMQITALPLGVTSPAEIDGQPVDPFFDDWCAFCLPANLTGQPAVSVPCGRDRGGLPIGLQVMARRFDEHLALDVAAACAHRPLALHAVPYQGVALRWP